MAAFLSDLIQQRKSFVFSADGAHPFRQQEQLTNMLMLQENSLPDRAWSAPSRSPTKTPSMSLLLVRSSFSMVDGEGDVPNQA